MSTACWTASRGVSDALTSRSFHRGGAQHVNGRDGLTLRWIFDRGARNMSTTNKGFNYIFITSRGDRKVSKALSGYDSETNVNALDLKPFDTETQGMESVKYNLSQHVLDILTAYLFLHYPLMNKLQADGQVVRRLESAAANVEASVTELLAWSSHLVVCQAMIPETSQEQTTTPITEQSNQSKIIDHQRSVIDQLMGHIKREDERMDN
ncbi:Hypothetical protein PHPALM_5973 [Phytophthora palmivora]|uniref:Uncharacterized protein n=1 Tax=Phytophthora palmivora TaxID=4796 RepID=A0A2P4YG01_9STRA|nr:Hypothetical protein PHPALM_5973 [Phytophthora palmivora]